MNRKRLVSAHLNSTIVDVLRAWLSNHNRRAAYRCSAKQANVILKLKIAPTNPRKTLYTENRDEENQLSEEFLV